MSCRELTERITDWLEQRLPIAESTRVRLHLWWCRNCRAYLQQMRATIRLLARLGDR
jgi:hypothetical protein